MRLTREWPFFAVFLVAAALWATVPMPSSSSEAPVDACALVAQADQLCLVQPAEAVSLYEQAVRAGCSDEYLPVGHALSLARLGRLEEAAQVQAEALAVPRSSTTEQLLHNNLAWDLFLLRRPHDGMPHAQRALAMQPGEPCALDTRGALYAQLGQWDAAASDFRQAVAIQPQVGLFHAHLAVALLQQGDEFGAARERELAQGLPREHLEGNQYCHLCRAFDMMAP